jgi:Primosomal protein N'' (replication factor Y) - superfamily II helicase
MMIQIIPFIVLILAATVVLLVARRAKASHFECPVCGCAFKVSVATYLVSFHMLGKREVTCPRCGYRDFLPPIRDDES